LEWWHNRDIVLSRTAVVSGLSPCWLEKTSTGFSGHVWSAVTRQMISPFRLSQHSEIQFTDASVIIIGWTQEYNGTADSSQADVITQNCREPGLS